MHNPLTKNIMTSDEFAKNFYIEKLNFLKSCFEEQLKEVIDTLLTDVFYSVLLGLDGKNPIGNTHQTYKIYDKEGYLISNCGELKASVYEYFHGDKYEGTTFAPDFESN